MLHPRALAALIAVCGFTASACVPTQKEAVAQLDEVAAFMFDREICEILGYTVDDKALSNLLNRTLFAASDGADDAVKKVFEPAADRVEAQRTAEVNQALAGGSKPSGPGAQKWVDQQVGHCNDMAASPLLAGKVTTPRAEILQPAKAALVERILWAHRQTPAAAGSGSGK